MLLRGGGRQCETVAGLDHQDTMEYVAGQQVINSMIIFISMFIINGKIMVMIVRWCLTGSLIKV